MKNLIKMFVLLIILSINVFAQDIFFSADGGFKIDLPKNVSSSQEFSDYTDDFMTEGNTLKWENTLSKPAYSIQFTKYNSTQTGEKSKLTSKKKESLVNSFGAGLIDNANKRNGLFKETIYSANGKSGKEWLVIFPAYHFFVRAFFINNTFYTLLVTYSNSSREIEVLKTFDSFQLLSRKEIIDLKIKEAEPKPLPQSPSIEKFTSDAQDQNLKGKVKTVTEDYQETLKSQRELYFETQFNEQGNLTRETTYNFGYPDRIKVWGYIEGNRVCQEKETKITSDEVLSQRMRPKGTFMIDEAPMEPPPVMTAAANSKPLPRDERYDTKFTYKYNTENKLIEKTEYSNDGQAYNIRNFTYIGNRRETLSANLFINSKNRSVEIYDKNGDVIESSEFDDKGKLELKTTYKYELDLKGNWIVQRSFDNVKVKGRLILKPSSISYRKIVYYE
jgi:hypothetical protein